MGTKKRILIVDDHPMVRAGLTLAMRAESDFEVCGEAAGVVEALKLIEKERPDLVIVDLSLEEGSGIELIKYIKANHDEARTLVTSMHDETLFAERALHAGASGYVNKKEAMSKVVEAARTVLNGKIYLTERMSERVLSALANQPRGATSPMSSLSDRELEVFQCVGDGLSTREIAQKLHLSVKTIETHDARIKRKLGLKDHADLLRHAMQWVAEIGKGNDKREEAT